MNYLIVSLFLCLTLFGIEPKNENCLNSLNGKHYGGKIGFSPCYANGFGTVDTDNELYYGQWSYGDFNEQGILELKEASSYLEQFFGFGDWIYIVYGFFDMEGTLKFSCPNHVCQTSKVEDILPKITTGIFGRYAIVPKKITYAEFARNNQLQIQDSNDSTLIFNTLYISSNEHELIKKFEKYAVKKYIIKGDWKDGSLVVSVDNFFGNFYSKYPQKLGKKRPEIKISNHELKNLHEYLERINKKIPCTNNDLQYNPYEADNYGYCYESYVKKFHW